TIKTSIAKGEAANTAVTTTGLTFKGNNDTSTGIKKLGEELSITGADTNISTIADSTGIKVKLSENLDLTSAGSVTAGQFTAGNSLINSSGLTITGGPRFTSSGIDAGNQTIQGVVAGINNTDAANVGQVKAAKTEVVQGKNTTVTPSTGSDGQTLYTIDAEKTTVSTASSLIVSETVNDSTNKLTDYKLDLSVETKAAIAKGEAANTAVLDSGLKFNAEGGTSTGVKKLGEELSITGADNNISTIADSTGIKVKLSENLDLTSAGSVTAGQFTAGNSLINSSGLTITGGPRFTSSGIDAGNQTIQGVVAGINNTDAANVGQVKAAKTEVVQGKNTTVTPSTGSDGQTLYTIDAEKTTVSTASSLIVSETVNDSTNKLTDYKLDLSVETKAAIAKGEAANTAVLDSGLKFNAEGGTSTGVKKLGEELSITGADTNISTTADSTGIKVKLSENLDLTSAGSVTAGQFTAGNSLINSSGLTITGGPRFTSSGIDAGNQTIQGVVAGINNTDAANVGQVKAAKTEVVQGKNTTVTPSTGSDGQTLYTIDAEKTTVSTASSLIVSETINDSTNKLTNYKLDLSLETKDAIAKGEAANTTVTTTGLTFNANSGTPVVKKLGEELSITGADNNISTIADANGIQVKLSKDLQLTADGSIALGLTTVQSGTIQVDNINIANGAIVGLTNKTLTSIDFATLGRAATEEQLKLVAEGQMATSNAAVKYATSEQNGNTVVDYQNIVLAAPEAIVSKDATTNKISTTGGTTISNLASAGDYTNVDNATKAVNAGDLNNAVLDVVDKGLIFTANSGTAHKATLGTSISIKGAEDNSAFSTESDHGKNIYTQVETDGTIRIGLANNLDLGVQGSILVGSTSIVNGAVTGLSNKTLTSIDFATLGRAATEEQLKLVAEEQMATSNAAVKYATSEQNGNTVVDYQNIVLAAPEAIVSKDATTNKISTTGGTTISNLASAGDYTNVDNATKAVNAGDLNNAVLDVVDKGLTFTANSGTAHKATLGTSISIKGAEGNSAFSTQSDQGKNIYTQVESDGTIRVGLANNVDLGANGSVQVGTTNVSNGSVTGLSNTTWTGTNVQADRAATEGQLQSAINQVNNEINQLTDGVVQYDRNPDGSVNKNSITLGNGTDATTITNVAQGNVTETSKDAVNGSQLWDVQQQVNQNRTDIDNIQQSINNGSIGLVNQVNSTSDITVAKNTAGKVVNITGTDGERIITGLDKGAVNESSTQAVNGSQLNTTNQALVQYLGGGASYSNETFEAPSYYVGGNADAYRNVGDAINALDQANQNTNSRIDNIVTNIEQSFYNTNKRINDIEKRANAGIAAAMAMESAPYVAGKLSYSAAGAYHGGENAVGVTLRKTADNGRWSMTGGIAAASQGDPSFRIGISGVID
ncbi:hypothetical protein G9F32_16235, partial [Acinetobacter sp. 194]|uniref:YadA-like family protein n=1 Tax=Acinetobacter shaoyimingii TaxID=2715164 RepID=UPI00149066B7